MAKADNPNDGYNFIAVAFGGTLHGQELASDNPVWEADGEKYSFAPVVTDPRVGVLVALWISDTCRDKSYAQIMDEVVQQWAKTQRERNKECKITSTMLTEHLRPESSTPETSGTAPSLRFLMMS